MLKMRGSSGPTILLLCTLAITTVHSRAIDSVRRQAISGGSLFGDSQFCDYTAFQANVVENSLYMFGGNVTLKRGVSSRSKRAVEPGFQFFKISLNSTFSTNSNTSSFVTRQPDPATVKAVANTRDGAAYTYNNELYFYGGVATSNAANDSTIFKCTPSSENIVWNPNELNNGVHRLVAKGSAVMASTENKGFYFGGTPVIPKAADSGQADTLGPRTNAAPNLIVSQFQRDGSQVWSNITTTNTDIQAYNQGNLVFVPAGKEGLLVLIGGQNQSGAGAWTHIPVFDIATSTWFTQNTRGSLVSGDSRSPGAQTCSIIVSAPNNAWHNVYVYGGDNRDSGTAQLSILTIPAFQWTTVNDPTYSPKRSSQCILTGDRQMLIIGGSTDASGDEDCGSNSFLEILDLSTLQLDAEFPNNQPYTIPTVISNYTTLTAPVAGWSTPAVSGIYGQSYRTAEQRSGGTSNTGAIVGGVVGGVGGALILACTALFIYRNWLKQQKKRGSLAQQPLMSGSPPRHDSITPSFTQTAFPSESMSLIQGTAYHQPTELMSIETQPQPAFHEKTNPSRPVELPMQGNTSVELPGNVSTTQSFPPIELPGEYVRR